MALRWIKAFLSRRSFRVCVFATLVSCADVPLGTQPGFHAWTSVFPYMNKWSAGVSWRSMYDACGRCQLSCLRWIVSRICKRTGIAFRNGQWQWNYILKKINVITFPYVDFSPQNLVDIQLKVDEVLLWVPQIRSIRVLLNERLSSLSLVDAAVKKVPQSLLVIGWSFFRFIPNIFIHLPTKFVTPHNEYCVQTWAPRLRWNVDKLERVLFLATKWFLDFVLYLIKNVYLITYVSLFIGTANVVIWTPLYKLSMGLTMWTEFIPSYIRRSHD